MIHETTQAADIGTHFEPNSLLSVPFSPLGPPRFELGSPAPKAGILRKPKTERHKAKKDLSGNTMDKKFRTVEEMLNAGYYKTRHGMLKPLDPSWKVGIPDDDVILSHEEVNLLLDAIYPDDKRSHLLFGLMFRTGARVSQNLQVKVQDIDFVDRRVFIRRAKEGKSFYRYLDDGFLSEIAEYIKHYGLKGNDYLFSIYYKNVNFGDWYKSDTHINRRTVNYWLYRYAEKAGIQYYWIDENGHRRRRVHAHSAKYTVASWIYAECKDSLATALSVGNLTTEVIERAYIKIPSSYRKRIVEKALDHLVAGSDIKIELKSRCEMEKS